MQFWLQTWILNLHIAQARRRSNTDASRQERECEWNAWARVSTSSVGIYEHELKAAVVRLAAACRNIDMQLAHIAMQEPNQIMRTKKTVLGK